MDVFESEREVGRERSKGPSFDGFLGLRPCVPGNTLAPVLCLGRFRFFLRDLCSFCSVDLNLVRSFRSSLALNASTGDSGKKSIGP